MKHTSTHPQATLRVACLTFALLLTGFLLRAQPGTFDPSFNPIDRGFGLGDGASSEINDFAVLPDGKILIGGFFNTYNSTLRNGIARLNADGSLDMSFQTGSGFGANPSVYRLALQPDGKILVRGNFTRYNGATRLGLARLNPDGSLDTGFDAGEGGNNVNDFAVLPDGKILVGGRFFSGTSLRSLTRLNADGSPDTGFDPGVGANHHINSIIQQPDGKILILGLFTAYNGTPRPGIARVNPDGSLDMSFDPGVGANAAIQSMVRQSDGKILIRGDFTSYNGTPRNRIARLNADGSLDTGFNPDTRVEDNNFDVDAIASLPAGKVLVGGRFKNYNGTPRNHLVRLNADGSLDMGFDPVASLSNIYTLAPQPDGRILIGAGFSNHNGTDPNRIARLNADGSLDTSFNPSTGARGRVSVITLQPDRKILIGGSFLSSYNGIARGGIARLNADGSLDMDFDPRSRYDINPNSIALQPDGKILIAGSYLMLFNGIVRRGLARLNADGSLDMGFNPGEGANSTVQSVTLQPDGKILVGGWFTRYNGTELNRIARLNADGTLDMGFNPGAGTNGSVDAVVWQPDGKILIVGSFTSYNGTSRTFIARLNPNGSLDTGFDPGASANDGILDVALQPDGKILIGGSFTSYNGTPRNRLARLNADGSLDTGFNPGDGANSTVQSVTLQPNGKILIGGNFTNYNGTARNRLARLNTDGSLDTGFDPGAGANNSIIDVALQPDGQMLIGGAFTSYDNTGRNRIARVNGDDGTSPAQCLALGDECSGNEQEIRRYTLNVPTGGSYPVSLTYRSHERATQLRLRVNGGSWQSLPLAQTASPNTYMVTNLGSMALRGGANTIELASGGGYICFRELCAENPAPPQTQCLALGNECSGNEQEIRRYTLNIPTSGSYPLSLSYRSHERATQLRLRINGGNWQSLPLAQTPADLSYLTIDLGKLALVGGANIIELASGGGYVCFRELCAETPAPQNQCLSLGDACSGNEQEIQRYTLNVTDSEANSLALSYRSPERATQLRLRINGGAWQSFPLAQTASSNTYAVTYLPFVALKLGANTIELASAGGYVCFRELCYDKAVVNQGQCLALDEFCTANGQEVQSYNLNVLSNGLYPMYFSYRSPAGTTPQVRLRINGGSWQSYRLRGIASSGNYEYSSAYDIRLQRGANTIELASDEDNVCFREICIGRVILNSSRMGLPEAEGETSQKLTVSPNPGGGEFVARFYAQPGQAMALEVVDMQGRRLWRRGLRGEGWHSERVHLPHAAAGTYLLLLHPDEASAPGQSEYKRVVIVK